AGIAGDVTCGPDVRVAGSQPVVDEHSPIDVQPRLFGEPDSGNHPDAHDDEVGGHGRAIVQHHGVFGDALDAPAQPELDAVLTVQVGDEPTQRLAGDPGHRHVRGGHDR